MLRWRATLLAPALAASVLVSGAATRPSAAAFTGGLSVPGNAFTVDALRSHFAATPSLAIVGGDVDTLAIAFGLVTSPQTFGNVFQVSNPTAAAQTATLVLNGPAQIAAAVFAATGTTSVTLAPGASSAVAITTSTTTAGRGAGTLRLGVSGQSWLYRDYPLSIDQAPAAPASLTATPRAAGRIALAWAASTTTNLAGYDVYRSTGGGPLTKLTGTPVAATTYDDNLTAHATSYSYVVRAVSSGTPDFSSLDSPAASATADAVAPGAPTGSYVDNRTPAADEISGTAEAGATITVTRTLPSAAGPWTTTASAGGAYRLSVADVAGKSSAKVTVSYSVTATDAAGNVSAQRVITFSDAR